MNNLRNCPHFSNMKQNLVSCEESDQLKRDKISYKFGSFRMKKNAILQNVTSMHDFVLIFRLIGHDSETWKTMNA